MNKKTSNQSTLQWLYRVPGKKKVNVLLLTLLEAVHDASGVFYALFLKKMVDGAVAGYKDSFIQSAVFLVALVLSQLLMRVFIRHYYEKNRAELENIFKGRLFDVLLRKDYGAVWAIHSGEWMNRLTGDAKVVADAYTEILPGAAGMVIKLISAFVLMLVLEPGFTLILLPMVLVFLIVALLFRGRLKGLHKRIQERDGSLRGFLQERLSGMLMLRAFSAQGESGMEAEKLMEDHKKARLSRYRIINLANFAQGFVLNGMYVFAAIWCGWGILVGRISYGTLTAITQLVAQIQNPFANISGYLPRWYAMLASAERLMEAEAFEEELQTAPRSLAEAAAYYHNDLKTMVFDRVSFSYPDTEDRPGNDALGETSLRIAKGEILALTGPSGCGKSTLLKLLLCVYHPQNGEIRLEDEKGEQVLLSAEHRRLFAYVPQGNLLLHGSIREAVSFGAPEQASEDSRIWEALEMACAADFVRQQEKGLDTVLGERGSGLSEGQLQRLAIARAIFSGSPILLLDEATASLDGETEEKLLRNIKTMTDKTLLIVTHRPAALSICDRVVHFSEGGIEP